MNEKDKPADVPRAELDAHQKKRVNFYEQTLHQLITDKNASILVLGGGLTDRNVLHKLGFSNVVISNVGRDIAVFSPYQTTCQDAENITYQDAAFDYVIEHNMLHHCFSPHRALLEMFRVSKRGLLAIEARDSFCMRIIQKLNPTATYEVAAVFYNMCNSGGVNNSNIPNYVYRWTEREIEKTINSFAPYAKHKIIYKYGLDAPVSLSLIKGKYAAKTVLRALFYFYKFFTLLFPKQKNLFAFFVSKTSMDLHNVYPWLKLINGKIEFNKEWAENIFKPADQK